MNKYVILERQESKLVLLERERALLSIDIRYAKGTKELDETEKRIKSLRRKRDYLYKQMKENAKKGLGKYARIRLADYLERLDGLVKRRKKSLIEVKDEKSI